MANLIRDSVAGQCLRIICNPSWLRYDEEQSDYDHQCKKLQHQHNNTILVDWYSDDDKEKPQNWSRSKKAFVAFVIGAYSFVVYLAAPIYMLSENVFREEFGVNGAEGSLGLALYVLGYGAGPLFFSPLSEVPQIGRNLPYALAFALFCIISIPTAITPTAIGFYVLCFLQGFFGSPCLATGGASIADVYSSDVLPHAMSSWVLCIFCASAIGTLVSGFATPVLGKASLSTVVRESLLVPSRITFLDPAILFLNCYTSLTYGIYYSFFEAFPIVYQGMYGFNLGQMGAAFLAIVVGTIISFVIYNIYIHKTHVPKSRSPKAPTKPETVLIPALFACFGPSIGLFLFGWAARPEIHWIVPTIGIVIYPACVFILMQCVFLYIPGCYPQYAASVFAATDFTRSAFACGAIIFSRPLYLNLGVGRGCSLLAGLTIGCVLGIYLLFHYGEALRRRSRFVAKWWLLAAMRIERIGIEPLLHR